MSSPKKKKAERRANVGRTSGERRPRNTAAAGRPPGSRLAADSPKEGLGECWLFRIRLRIAATRERSDSCRVESRPTFGPPGRLPVCGRDAECRTPGAAGAVAGSAAAVFTVFIVFIVLRGLIWGLQGLIFLALARLSMHTTVLHHPQICAPKTAPSRLNFALRHGILCTVKDTHT